MGETPSSQVELQKTPAVGGLSATPQPAADPLWNRPFTMLLLANFAVLGSLMMVMTLLPVHLQQRGLTPAEIGVVVAVFNLAGTSVRLFVGREMDKSGTRWMVLAAVLLFALSNLAYAWAIGAVALLALRAVHGVAWGVFNTGATVAVIDKIPVSRRGEGLNIYAISAALPTAFMPWLALALAEQLSFLAAFSVAFALPMLASAIFSREDSSTSPDLAAGPRPVLIDPHTVVPGLTALTMGATYGAVTTLTPLYLLGLGSVGTGLFFLIFTVAVISGRFFLRRIYDRYGVHPLLVWTPPVIAVGLVVLSLEVSVAVVLVSAVLYGAGFGICKPAIQAWCVDRAPTTRRAAANAMFYTGFEFGVASGAVAFGTVATLLGYGPAYTAVSVVPLLALALYLVDRRRAKAL